MSQDCASMTAPLVWGSDGPKNVSSLGLNYLKQNKKNLKLLKKYQLFLIFSQNGIFNVVSTIKIYTPQLYKVEAKLLEVKVFHPEDCDEQDEIS